MTMAAPTDQRLSAALKDQTATAHSSAENSPFMSSLGKGELDRAAVAELTVQYFHIYSALEDAVRRAASHPAVAQIADERLERVPALEADLTAMLGAGWKETTAPLDATRRYVAELEALTPDSGPEVIAHHYVRYLGDISGGQVLARVFQNAYALPDEALHFYNFSAVGKIPHYRAHYKEALDAMQLNDEERARIISTAQHVFALNQAVFQDLSTHAG